VLETWGTKVRLIREAETLLPLLILETLSILAVERSPNHDNKPMKISINHEISTHSPPCDSDHTFTSNAN
jgi:hypothetical protein